MTGWEQAVVAYVDHCHRCTRTIRAGGLTWRRPVVVDGLPGVERICQACYRAQAGGFRFGARDTVLVETLLGWERAHIICVAKPTPAHREVAELAFADGHREVWPTDQLTGAGGRQ